MTVEAILLIGFVISFYLLWNISVQLTSISKTLEQELKRIEMISEGQKKMIDAASHWNNLVTQHLYDMKLILDPEWQTRRDQKISEGFKAMEETFRRREEKDTGR